MPRYYEAEALIEFVKNNSPHINGETTLECVERAIMNAPTEDVVPRGEVERLQGQVNRLKAYDEERDIALHQRLVREAKQEVAKEIIDDLIKTVDDNEFPCDTHDNIMWVVNSDFLTDFINDAKKKYIGE